MEKSHAAPSAVEIIESDTEAPLLRISGELDHYTADRFEQAVRETVTGATRCVLLDVTGLHYVDSGGIAAFSRLLRSLEARGWVGIIGMDERVRRVFVITGLASHPHLRFFSTVDEAYCGYRSPSSAPAVDDDHS